MFDVITVPEISRAVTKILALSVASLALAVLLTPVYTYLAYHFKFWKKQRKTSTTGEQLTVFNKLHAEKFKRNIPTMAGIVTVFSILFVTAFANMDRSQTWLLMAALLGGGMVGLIDDWVNIRGNGNGSAGLRPWLKFSMITAVALVGALFFYDKLGHTAVHIPFWGSLTIDWLIIPLFVAAVVSTGNAVNISDGLDGLAGGLLATAYGTFGVIAILQGSYGIAGFCFTVVGALLAYIWFNIFPARFFMGDVGSFALGTALGAVAMLTNTIFLLPIIGLVFVAEAGSSLLQILSKKIYKRKIFLSAPIHHHFEAKGWPETKVTMRFWVIGQVVGMLGLWLAITGGHIR
jgi:phospho-N-acetylmuramoyl-pentapeptide-transferase